MQCTKGDKRIKPFHEVLLEQAIDFSTTGYTLRVTIQQKVFEI